MTWVKLDDGFADHPKIVRAGPTAAWLHVAALCYCARHLTDGRIAANKVRTLTELPRISNEIRRLTATGLWTKDGDDYVIHDYLKYQPSRADVEAIRDREREKKRRQRAQTDRNTSGQFQERPHGTTTGTPQGTPTGTADECPQGTPPGCPPVPVPSRPNYLKGGGYLQPADATAPPLSRCPEHANTEGPVPPCGACADARRTHDAWTRTNGNGTTPDPFAAMQAAARLRAEEGAAKVHELAEEPPDPDAAKKVSQLLEQHRLTRKDPA